MPIEPTSQQAKALLKLPKDKPVVMLNLLRFKETSDKGNESGRDAYARYAANVMPLIKAQGGRAVWAGDARSLVIGESEDTWDQVIMVEYPNPRAFIKMSSSEEYAAIHHDREAGLETTVLLCCEAMPLPDL